MVDHVRKQIRDAAVTALTGLTTTGARVKNSAVYPMQDADLPGLRIDPADESIEVDTISAAPVIARTLELVVEACVKQTGSYNDALDTIIKEVEIAIAGNQAIGGAKYALLKSVKTELSGDGEKPVAVGTLTFEVLYYTALDAPTVAL